MKNRKLNWRLWLLGTAVGVLTMVCITAVGAALMAKGAVSPEMMGYWSAGILTAMGLAGGMTALLGGGDIPDAAVTAAGELAVLFALNGVLSGGRMEGVGVSAVALMGGCGAAMLLRLGQGRSGRRRRRRK